MKTGIMTFPNSTSYGATLQMFALCRTLDQIGCDVEIINYHNEYMKDGRHTTKLHKTNSWKRRGIRAAQYLIHNRQYRRFRSFEKTMPMYPNRAFSEKSKLVQIGKRYRCIICGSDQVWNPDITGSDLSFFLDFCTSETMRVSYAPSFGHTTFSQSFQKAVIGELEKFSHISVREQQGKDWIQSVMGKAPELVLDPTFLLSSEEWQEFEQNYPVKAEKYVFYYTIRHSETLFNFCTELAKREGFKILIVGGNVIQKIANHNPNIIYACDLDPREWLYLLHGASYVITNSFHGTAFAINYHKDFFVEFSSLTNARLENIVRTFGLENRIVRPEMKNIETKTDYTYTDQILPELRKTSLQFLQKATMK